MERILDDGLQAARRREHPDPEPTHFVRAIPPSRLRSRTSSPRVSKVDDVQNVRRRSIRPTQDQIAKSGHAVLVEFEIRGDADKASDKIAPVLNKVAEAQQAHPRLFIGEFGDASVVNGVETAFGEDLARAGMLSLPITLTILVVAFGALVAAGIPLLLAPDRGLRDVRAARGAQPPAPDGDAGPGDRAPDRARGRGRLLDVLPAARARGARRRSQHAALRSRRPRRRPAARC